MQEGVVQREGIQRREVEQVHAANVEQQGAQRVRYDSHRPAPEAPGDTARSRLRQ